MTTLDLNVAEDAHEDHTDSNYSASATVVTCTAHTSEAANRRYFGLFLFVLTAEIPAGATIDACFLTVQANALAADDPNVDIHFEDVADADDLTTTPDVTNRVPTTASTQWTATGIGTSPVSSPSLVAGLQELVDTYGGLANGATVGVLVRGRNDALMTFAVVSLEGTGAPADLHVAFTAAGGVSGTVNQASETDTAQAVSGAKSKAVGQLAETDVAQPVARLKTLAVGQAAQVETAQAITASKTLAVGQVGESDTAQIIAVGGGIVQAVWQVSESETAQTVTALKTVAVGQVSGTDTAQTVTASKTVAVGQVSESDSVLAVTASKIVAVGQAVGTGVALAITWTGLDTRGGSASIMDEAYHTAVLADEAYYQAIVTDEAFYTAVLEDANS